MDDSPWLTIVGFGEDGLDGLARASREAIDNAEVIIAPPRHLAMIPVGKAEQIEWPVPFADGLPRVDACRGRRTVVLASGDPFWFGAGRLLAERYAASEWRAFPGPSAFSLAASRLGWGLERCICLGLHAAPLAGVRPHLAAGARILVTLRDGAAVEELSQTLAGFGFGDSQMTVMEALGGPRERIRTGSVKVPPPEAAHPVLVAIEVWGGAALSLAPGRADEIFESDGQITRAPVRAMTLAALAPVPGAVLWDIGGGSGSVGIEWLLSHPTTLAVAIEPRQDRADRIGRNAKALGVPRLKVVCGSAPDALAGLSPPDAVFVGGGMSPSVLETAWSALASGGRMVVNAVTLEGEALLSDWQGQHGGTLTRIEMSQMAALGSKRAWKPAYPIVQWAGVK